METMAGKKPRRRRSFTPEFKAEVVALVRQTGKTVGAVAREMDLTETAVREWVKQAERDEGVRADGLTTAERAEMAQLRKDLRETREERDILKRGWLSSPFCNDQRCLVGWLVSLLPSWLVLDPPPTRRVRPTGVT